MGGTPRSNLKKDFSKLVSGFLRAGPTGSFILQGRIPNDLN